MRSETASPWGSGSLRRAALALVALAASVLLAPRAAHACLWDYDTFKEESLGKRDLAAVLTGDLQKHSRAFYDAKVLYTRPMIDRGTAPKERYDDLAVALAKLGQLDEAIAILTAKEAKYPGEYTSLANLGTFLMMKGDLQGALAKLNAAVAKWPDAHFGREVFQLKLLEFALRVAKDPELAKKENFLGLPMSAEAAGIATTGRGAREAKKRVPDKAIEALVGMIRFGEGHDSALVWTGLAWVLAWRGDAQLAVRALRRAELTGAPEAAQEGGTMAITLHSLMKTCCPGEGELRAKAWKRLSQRLDREWAAGQATTARRQAAEERKIARQQWKAAFGY
jgi:tetratricopeptide (TPR) repeat protein